MLLTRAPSVVDAGVPHRAHSRAAERALAWYWKRRERAVAELSELVRFPTVSADPRHARDARLCAAWLASKLARIGFPSVRRIGTTRPIVVAERRTSGRRPTLLVYGHYDVQPADPLAEWRSPPFQPTLRGESLYGRGASDDKGQLLAHVHALEAWLAANGELPIDVVCALEGEEEVGSTTLRRWLASGAAPRAIDVAVVSDTPMLGADRPALTYALRGRLSFELEVEGAAHDLHSGLYGGALPNPVDALCSIVAGLHDRGRIAIPGVYASVRRWSSAERARMAAAGPSDAEILDHARARAGAGEPGYSLYERTTLRPALIVNGIRGGYQGPGAKDIVPAHALAKLSFRIVPDQDPRDLELSFRRAVARLTPPGVRATVRRLASAPPVLVPRRHPAVRAAARALRRGFGREPSFVRSGGTIPVVEVLQRELGVPTVLLGFALPSDRPHAPNEHVHLPTFHRSVATAIAFLDELTRTTPTRERDPPRPRAIRTA